MLVLSHQLYSTHEAVPDTLFHLTLTSVVLETMATLAGQPLQLVRWWLRQFSFSLRLVTAELQGTASPLGLNPGSSALCADAFLCLFCSQRFHEFPMLRTGDCY